MGLYTKSPRFPDDSRELRHRFGSLVARNLAGYVPSFVHHYTRCREQRVGYEIAWPGKESEAFDQEWYSEIDGRVLRFSAFAYQYISYDLVLDGWIERSPTLTGSESRILEHAARLRALMDECERAAKKDENHQVLQRVPIVREWIDALESAVLHRVDVDNLSRDSYTRSRAWMPDETCVGWRRNKSLDRSGRSRRI